MTDPTHLTPAWPSWLPAEGSAGSTGYGFRLAPSPAEHLRYRHTLSRIVELHRRQRQLGTGEGMLITGPSGVGKSTILRNYAAMHPWRQEAQRTHIPVLLVTVPSSPTTRSLAGAMLYALGRHNTHRASAPEKTFQLRELFLRCGVELVLLDEFHHLFYPPTLTAFRDLTDWLKNLIEDTRMGLVGVGLPAAQWVVESNEQLNRRFSERIRLTPFSYEDPEDFLEFRGILKSFASRLPLPQDVPLHEANLARRFLVASYGLLDYLIKILEGAISVATAAGHTSLSLATYAAGFRQRVWRDVPDRLNPFHPESPLRPLDRVGEVFHLHTQADPVGRAFARKLGLGPTDTRETRMSGGRYG